MDEAEDGNVDRFHDLDVDPEPDHPPVRMYNVSASKHPEGHHLDRILKVQIVDDSRGQGRFVCASVRRGMSAHNFSATLRGLADAIDREVEAHWGISQHGEGRCAACGQQKRKLRICWTCPAGHQHRYWWVAQLCCKAQQARDGAVRLVTRGEAS